MDLGIRGRVGVITGASGGIGSAVARELAREGVRLVLVGCRHDCSELARDIRSEGGDEPLLLQSDVSSKDQAKRIVDEAIARFGRLDILVNNAGIGCKGTIAELDEGQWKRTLDVNLNGAFFLSKYAVSPMQREGWGRIVNIGSLAAKNAGNARPWCRPESVREVSGAAYAVSKAGLHCLTRCQAKEVAHLGVTVNAVAPGPIATPMNPELPECMHDVVPAGRMGTPEEVANLVAFLVSERSGYITGEIVDINGGIWMD